MEAAKFSVNVREVLNGIFYILWTGCQSRPRQSLIPRAQKALKRGSSLDPSGYDDAFTWAGKCGSIGFGRSSVVGA
jgi:transposase